MGPGEERKPVSCADCCYAVVSWKLRPPTAAYLMMRLAGWLELQLGGE